MPAADVVEVEASFWIDVDMVDRVAGSFITAFTLMMVASAAAATDGVILKEVIDFNLVLNNSIFDRGHC